MTEDEIQMNLVRLGVEAEAFTRSHFGRYLFEKADKHIYDNTDGLIACEPDDVQCNTKYRNEIMLGAMFKQFLDEAVMEGRKLSNEIKNQEAVDY